MPSVLKDNLLKSKRLHIELHCAIAFLVFGGRNTGIFFKSSGKIINI